MSGKAWVLILAVFGIVVFAAFRARLASRRPGTSAAVDNVTLALNNAVATVDAAPYGVGVQPSFPSPDQLSPDSSGSPAGTPVYFAGSIPSAS